MIPVVILSLLIALWIASGIVLSMTWGRTKSMKQKLVSLLHARRDSVPLLINLMKPYVIKADEVFARCVLLHRTLLFMEDFGKEKELSAQIEFLFSVAQHHPDLLQDKRFAMTKRDMMDLADKIHPLAQQYNAAGMKYNRWKKITFFVLFPPAFFLFSFLSADL